MFLLRDLCYVIFIILEPNVTCICQSIVLIKYGSLNPLGTLSAYRLFLMSQVNWLRKKMFSSKLQSRINKWKENPTLYIKLLYLSNRHLPCCLWELLPIENTNSYTFCWGYCECIWECHEAVLSPFYCSRDCVTWFCFSLVAQTDASMRKAQSVLSHNLMW